MIIGREREQRELLSTKKKASSQLVIVYGRRRVGKTFLVNETFGNSFAFKLTGDYKKPMNVQLNNFSDELKNRCNDSISLSKMTFLHQMTRLILLEQIYSAFKILRN